MKPQLRYNIVFTPGITTAVLDGNIDERVGPVLTEIRKQIRTRRAAIDLDGLGILNSIGCSVWLAHIKAFDDLQLAYTRCPYTFTSLCLLIPDLLGKGTIESFYVRYYCDACDTGDSQNGLVKAAEAVRLGTYPTMPCARCKAALGPEAADLDFLRIFVPKGKSA